MPKIFLYDTWNRILRSYPTTNHMVGKMVYDQLITIYTSDNRKHHDIKHIIHYINTMMALFNVYKFDDIDIHKCILAAFFHDTEYNTKTPHDTNAISDETLSAMYASSALKKIGFNEDFVSDVHKLILLSEHHKINESYDIDPLLQSIFIDSDMAILGEDPFLYTQYSNAIREEYKNIEQETFILGRKNFLSKLYKYKTIFLTEYMNELYNDTAHSNIENEIKELNRLYVDLITT